MPILGDLERAVMDVLWAAVRPTSVREVHEQLAQGRDIAYTTVMTVLDRLAKKGVVVRQLDGRAWLYQPAKSKLDLYVDAFNEELAVLTPQEQDLIRARISQASAGRI